MNELPAITDKELERGFSCLRDEFSIAEVKTLTAASQRGCVVSLVRLAA